MIGGCTINYKIEPEKTTTEKVTKDTKEFSSNHPPLPPGFLPPGVTKEVNKSCLVTSLAPLDSVKQVKKEDYRADKNIVGYINELERQHELLLKVKEQYERCKLQD
jgi:hypothetical protein